VNGLAAPRKALVYYMSKTPCFKDNPKVRR